MVHVEIKEKNKSIFTYKIDEFGYCDEFGFVVYITNRI